MRLFRRRCAGSIPPSPIGGLSETYLGVAGKLWNLNEDRTVSHNQWGTRFDCTRKGILRAVEASVQRLRLMSVDRLLLHDPDKFYHKALDVAFLTLVESHRQGATRGLSARR